MLQCTPQPSHPAPVAAVSSSWGCAGAQGRKHRALKPQEKNLRQKPDFRVVCLEAFNTQFPSTMKAALGHVGGFSRLTARGCHIKDASLQRDITFWYLSCSAGLPPREQIPAPQTQHIDRAVCCLCPLQSSSSTPATTPISSSPLQGTSHTQIRKKRPSEDGLPSPRRSLED